VAHFGLGASRVERRIRGAEKDVSRTILCGAIERGTAAHEDGRPFVDPAKFGGRGVSYWRLREADGWRAVGGSTKGLLTNIWVRCWLRGAGLGRAEAVLSRESGRNGGGGVGHYGRGSRTGVRWEDRLRRRDCLLTGRGGWGQFIAGNVDFYPEGLLIWLEA